MTTALRLIGLALALASALALAQLGAAEPFALLVPPLVLAAWAAFEFADRRPAAAFSMAVFAVLLSGTKFRMRDPTASLEATVDAQIVMELATIGLAGLLTVGAARRTSLGTRRLTGSELAFVGFGLLAALSALWSAAPLLTLVRAGQLAVVVGMALVMPRVLGPAGTVRALGSPLVVYTVGCAVLAKLFPWAKGTTVDYLGFHRFTWFAVHPIVAATLAAMAALFVLAELLCDREPLRRRLLGIPLWLALPPLLAVLAVTNSRGPLLAFAVAAGALVLMRRAGALGLLAGVAIAVLVPLLVVATGQTMEGLLELGRSGGWLFDKLLYRGQSLDEITTFTGRAELWEVTRGLIAEHRGFGVGYLGSRAALLEAAPWAAYAHNALLQTLLDLGVVGALLLWTPIVRSLFVGGVWDPRRESPEPLARTAAMTMIIFLIVNSMTAESFAAAPGYETLVVMVAVLLAAKAPAAARRAVARPIPERRLIPRPLEAPAA